MCRNAGMDALVERVHASEATSIEAEAIATEGVMGMPSTELTLRAMRMDGFMHTHQSAVPNSLTSGSFMTLESSR
jgi:hypothetical protein